jgi:hypothetical protein
MVYHRPGELQWDDLLSDTSCNSHRWNSLQLDDKNLELYRRWTVEQYDVLQHGSTCTSIRDHAIRSKWQYRDELQPDLHLE